jgi:hypothetical protein
MLLHKQHSYTYLNRFVRKEKERDVQNNNKLKIAGRPL